MSDLAEIIRATGVNPGDTVYVHADLIRLGLERDHNGRIKLSVTAKALFDAIKTVIGESGTIVAPSYSYSWSRGEIYSPEKSPGTMGLFSEHVRLHEGSWRSAHPILSLVAHGNKARWLFENDGGAVYGENTPYARLCELNAILLMVAVPYCSIKDHVEALLRVPYRYHKRFSGTIETNGRESIASCSHFVRFSYHGQSVELGSFLEKLTASERTSVATVAAGEGEIHAIRALDAVTLLTQILSQDPYRFVTGLCCDRAVFDVLHLLNGYTSPAEGWRLGLDAEQMGNVEVWHWHLTRAVRSVLDAVGWIKKTEHASLSLSVGGERPGSEISMDVVRRIRPGIVDDAYVLHFLSRLVQAPTAHLGHNRN